MVLEVIKRPSMIKLGTPVAPVARKYWAAWLSLLFIENDLNEASTLALSNPLFLVIQSIAAAS